MSEAKIREILDSLLIKQSERYKEVCPELFEEYEKKREVSIDLALKSILALTNLPLEEKEVEEIENDIVNTLDDLEKEGDIVCVNDPKNIATILRTALQDGSHFSKPQKEENELDIIQ